MAEPIPIWYDYEAPSALSLPEANPELEKLVVRVQTTLGARGVAIANTYAGGTDRMICVASCGHSAPPVGTPLHVNRGISGRCIRENRALHSYDTRLDPRVDRDACELLGIRSLAIAPLNRDSRCIGILEVFSDRPGMFSAETLRALEQEAVLAAALTHDEAETADLQLSDTRERVSFLPRADTHDHEMRSGVEGPLRTEVGASRAVNPAAALDTEVDPPQFFSAYSQNKHHPLRWIVITIVVACMGFSAPKLIRRIGAIGAFSSSRVQTRTAVKPVTLSAAPPNLGATMPARAGLENDETSLVHSLARSAESGNVGAQAALAKHYALGNGVPADRVKATAWYIVAGAGGNRQAKLEAVRITHDLSPVEIAQVRFNVGKMFMDGIGGSPNLIAAYSWFALARAAGDIRANAAQQKLERRMTPGQLSEARNRAAEWLAAHHSKFPAAGAAIAADKPGGH